MFRGERAPSASPTSSLPKTTLPKTTLTACNVEGVATAKCGYVWVPQGWARPDGPTMPLRVVVLPATGTSNPAAPLFYLAGWGGGAAGDAAWAAQNFAGLNRTMDLVFVDQRGTPGS